MEPTHTQTADRIAPAPLCVELEPAPVAEQVFRNLATRRHCLYFDSALQYGELGRYSFVTTDPFATLEVPVGGGDALQQLGKILQPCAASRLPDLPPFQGGAAGLLSYELNSVFERVPHPAYDEFGLPALAMGLYDVVVAFDHQQDRAWILSHGLPETEPTKRRRRAERRLETMRQWLIQPASLPRRCLTRLPRQALAPCFPVAGPSGLVSNFSAAAYQEAVRRAICYINAGDVFQVNLSQRLLFPSNDDAVSLYLRLRRRNPATFAAYFDFGAFQICSASPERFLSVRGLQVEARPIKGTRPRLKNPEADLFAANELKQSEKDLAENVMIVDLLRNDLSRVCQSDSIRVRQLCELETYAYVQHLVSVIEGRLSQLRTPLDLWRCTFPGGSVTGAPKIRAMEIIAELEPTCRGAYCGSLGYLGFDGTLDSNILIRTITAGRGWWQLPVGGGIVTQSTPELEYQETWHKAEGLIRALAP